MQSAKNKTAPSANGNSRGRYGKTYRNIRIGSAEDVDFIKSLLWGPLTEEDVIALLIKACRVNKVTPVYPTEEATSEIANGSLSVTEPVS